MKNIPPFLKDLVKFGAMCGLLLGILFPALASAQVSTNFWKLSSNILSPILSTWTLQVTSQSSDPTGSNGAIYYNTGSNAFRCFQNGAWTNCIGSGGSLTGGTAGMIPAWTSASSLTATSGPTASFFYATSTTATSTFMNAVTIGASNSYLLVSSTTPNYGFLPLDNIDAGGTSNAPEVITTFNNSAEGCAGSGYVAATKSAGPFLGNFSLFFHSSTNYTGINCINTNQTVLPGPDSTLILDPNGSIVNDVSGNGSNFRWYTGPDPAFQPKMVLGTSGQFGLSTSTPWAQLSIQLPTSPASTTMAFVIASSTVGATTTLFSVNNTGLTTGINLNFTNATTTTFFATYASTTNFYSQGLGCAVGYYLTWSAGNFGCAQDQTTSGATPFTWLSNFGTTSVIATTSSFWTQGVFFSSSTLAASQLSYASTTEISATTASTTNLIVSGVGTFNGGSGSATTTFNEGVSVNPVSTVSASVSTGGIFNLTNTSNDGAGMVLFTNHASGATGRLLSVDCNSLTFDQSCVNLQSQGTQSVLNISGSVNGLGTVKVAGISTGASNNSSALISVDSSVNSYNGQGVFIKASAATTTAALNILDGSSNSMFKVDGNKLTTMVFASSTAISNSGQASTTDFVVSNAQSALFLGDSAGKVTKYAGSSCSAGQFDTSINGSGVVTCAALPQAFTFDTVAGNNTTFATATAATTTSLWTQGVFMSSSTVQANQFPYASTTGLTAVTASTTNLYVSGITGVANNCLQASAIGLISGTGSACATALSGGTAGMIPAWTSSSALTSTSTPTVTAIYATTSSATSSIAGALTIGTTTQFTALPAVTTISTALNGLAGLVIATWVNMTNAFTIVNAAGTTVFHIDTNPVVSGLAIGTSTGATAQLQSVATFGNLPLNNSMFEISSSSQIATTTLFKVDSQGHFFSSTTVPTLSSCGTAPSIVNATNNHGTVLTGTGVLTGCTLTFANPYPVDPSCTVTSQSATNTLAYTHSTTGIVITDTSLDSDRWDYICIGN